MTVYVTVPILFYWTNVTKTCKSPAQSQILRQDERWEQPYKKHPKGDFFFFYLCVLLNILFRVRSLAAPSQGSQTSVNNLPCAKKTEKRKPTHTYTTLTLTKKGRIWAAPHGWAPRTLVVCMKPESRGADKMWNSWRGTGGKVSNKYLHMWRLEGGGGSQTFSCPGPPKWTHQTSVPLFPQFF